jgi:hypothetical protein
MTMTARPTGEGHAENSRAAAKRPEGNQRRPQHRGDQGESADELGDKLVGVRHENRSPSNRSGHDLTSNCGTKTRPAFACAVGAVHNG